MRFTRVQKLQEDDNVVFPLLCLEFHINYQYCIVYMSNLWWPRTNLRINITVLILNKLNVCVCVLCVWVVHISGVQNITVICFVYNITWLIRIRNIITISCKKAMMSDLHIYDTASQKQMWYFWIWMSWHLLAKRNLPKVDAKLDSVSTYYIEKCQKFI